MRKVYFTPKKNIDKYLNNQFNKDIYYQLTMNEEMKGLFEPLEFFNLLYEQIEILLGNTDKPTIFFNHLLGLGLDMKKLGVLLDYILRYIYEFNFKYYTDNYKETQLYICYEIIKIEMTKLKKELSVEQYAETETKEGNNVDSNEVKNGTKEQEEKLEPQENQSSPKANNVLGKFSNGQLVLIFYYFFESLGIKIRKDTDIAPIAKFMHLVLGKDFTNIQNSDLYKKLCKAPNYLDDKNLITELNFIKKFFEKVGLSEAVELIDFEIERCKKEIKYKN